MTDAQDRTPHGDLASVETGLGLMSDGLRDGFRRADARIGRRLSSSERTAWAREGLALARLDPPESIEAAAECFIATPEALGALGPSGLARWVRRGKTLCRDSSRLAVAYFRATPRVLPLLPEAMLDVWLALGPGLYRSAPQSVDLACRLIAAIPDLLPRLSLAEIERLTLFLTRLGDSSPDLASECLGSVRRVFEGIEGRDKGVFLSVALDLVRLNPRAAAEFFQMSAEALSRVDSRQRREFLSLVEAVARDDARSAVTLLAQGSRAFGGIDLDLHPRVMGMARALQTSPAAAVAFLQNCPTVLTEAGLTGMERWFEEGVRLLKSAPAEGLACFRLQHADIAMLHRLATRVSLDDAGAVLLLYGQALAGDRVALRASDTLPAWSMGRIRPRAAAAEESTIILPPFVDRYGSEDANFTWYKVAVTHQAGHVEFGSHDFSLAKEPALFRNRRPPPPPDPSGDLTDLERFFLLFADVNLAASAFAIAEDVRVDYLVDRAYVGIRGSYAEVRLESISRRPHIGTLPLRESFAEALVQLNLGGAGEVLPHLRPQLMAAWGILRGLRSPEAAAEDSAAAAVRLYEIMSAIPNMLVAGPYRGVDGSEEDEETFPHESLSTTRATYPSEVELEYHPPALSELDGNPQPEQRQIGTEMAEGAEALSSAPASPSGKDVKIRQIVEGEGAASGLFVTDLPEGATAERAVAETVARRAQGGPPGAPLSLEPEAVGISFLYDEWDYRAHSYLPQWCRVTEKPLAEGDAGFFDETLARNAALAAQIRRQFEMLVLSRRHRVNRLEDGEGIDVDAVVSAVVDRKAGRVPDTRVYWERRRTRRDVAAILLLDMSASTDDVIGTAEGYDQYPEWYLDIMWDVPGWREKDRDFHRRGVRRIIDVARESLVLMVNALEAVGDSYGVYGFSGFGRDNVQLLTVKGLEERFSDAVKGRIDGISPLHSTRMGPAIRHATARLDAFAAETKILFLVSDGYPQDREYGYHGNDREHALQDTRMAFVEARRKGITPFCLTVDAAGQDYLRTMVGDMGYEVVNDVEALAERLPALYRTLTA